MKRDEFDVVIVGSGAAGGWAAKKLTEAGLQVAVIEAGRALSPVRDFRDHDLPDSVPARGMVVPRKIREQQPVQSTSYAYNAFTHQHFIRDSDNPYTAPSDKPFDWIRSRQVGGRTTTWGRVCLRFAPLDFRAASHDGHGVDWPLTYEELAPYYDEVEQFIGVNGSSDYGAFQPAGRYQPPMHLSCGEELLKDSLRRFGRTLAIAPSAVLTEPKDGRASCHYCGPCERGCSTHSVFTSGVSTLPAAAKTGRLTLLTDTIVAELKLGKDDRVRAVECIDAHTGARHEVRGRVFALGASTLESTRLLLNSHSTRFPEGLGNTHGVLGRNLMDHAVATNGFYRLPHLSGQPDTDGQRPTPFYIPRFVNVQAKHPKFIRGYSFQGASHDTGRFGHAFAVLDSGVALQQALQKSHREWYLLMVGFAECLARPENRATLDPARKDHWGIPALRIDMRFGDNERALTQDMLETSAEMAASVGAVGPKVGVANPRPGSAVHEVGTARMGNDPTSAFLNRWNQSHEVPNLFVIDGAAFPSSPCQNPTLTIMALAARASDHIVEEMRRRNL